MNKLDWYQILGRQQVNISSKDERFVHEAIANNTIGKWIGGLSLSDLNRAADLLEDLSIQYIAANDFKMAVAAGKGAYEARRLLKDDPKTYLTLYYLFRLYCEMDSGYMLQKLFDKADEFLTESPGCKKYFNSFIPFLIPMFHKGKFNSCITRLLNLIEGYISDDYCQLIKIRWKRFNSPCKDF